MDDFKFLMKNIDKLLAGLVEEGFVSKLIKKSIPSLGIDSKHMKIDYFSDSNTVYNMLVIKKNELKIELQKQHQTANATSGPSSDIEIVPI
jgi:hypothetical protein